MNPIGWLSPLDWARALESISHPLVLAAVGVPIVLAITAPRPPVALGCLRACLLLGFPGLALWSFALTLRPGSSSILAQQGPAHVACFSLLAATLLMSAVLRFVPRAYQNRGALWLASACGLLALAADSNLTSLCFSRAGDDTLLANVAEARVWAAVFAVRVLQALSAASLLGRVRGDHRASPLARLSTPLLTASLLAIVLLPGLLGFDALLACPSTAPMIRANIARAAAAALACSAAASLVVTAVRWHPPSARSKAFFALAAAALSITAAEWMRFEGQTPWAIPGHIYANGLSVAQARLARQSSLAPVSVGFQPEALPQCLACHTLAGRRSLLDALASMHADQRREVLRELRDADQIGSPYRAVMPPLVASEREFQDLSSWLERAAANFHP